MSEQLFIFLLFITTTLYSNAQTTHGEAAIGGTKGDMAYSIAQTKDGGYAITGITYSFGDSANGDIYIAKLDSGFNLKWTKVFGGKNVDQGQSITATKDGGCAITGFTGSFGAGNTDIYIIRLDASGNLKWAETLGGRGADQGNSITQTKDGGFAIAGNSSSFGDTLHGDIYVVKLDTAGNLQWSRTIGGPLDEEGESIQQTADNGYAIAGFTFSYGDNPTTCNPYLVKLDSSGNLQWTKVIGGSVQDWAYSLIQSKDKGYVMAGETYSYGVNALDAYIIKLDSSGNVKWAHTIGGVGNDRAYSVIQTNDGGYVTAGSSGSFCSGCASELYLVKLDAVGKLLWTKAIEGPNKAEYGSSIISTSDKGFAVAGYTYSYGAGNYDMYAVKFDSAGNSCSVENTGGTLDSGYVTNIGGSISSINKGRVGSGSIISSGGTCTNICTLLTSVDRTLPDEHIIITAPNPFYSYTTIIFNNDENHSIELYDITGRKIETLACNNRTYKLYRNGLPQGIYFIKIYNSSRDFITSIKLIIN